MPRHYLVTFAFTLTVIVMLLGIALTPQAFRVISPVLLFCMTYAWMLFLPRAMPLLSLFVLGLINDVLLGLPLGIIPLTVLLLGWRTQRGEKHIKRNFTTIWLHFFLHLLVTFGFLMLVYSLYQWRWVAWQPLCIQALATFLCYPPLQLLIVWFLKQLKLMEHG